MNKVKLNKLRVAAALLFVPGFCSIQVLLAAQTPPTPSAPRATRAPAPFPPGAPYTVDGVVELLGGVKRKIMTEERLMMGLRTRQVTFTPSAAVLQRLIDAGASDAILGTVWKLSSAVPVPSPPPPPAKPAINILVKCGPGECETRVNERKFAATKNGETVFEGLDPGRAILDFKKAGFEPQTDIVDVSLTTKGETLTHNILLRPTRETQRQWGQEILGNMAKSMNTKGGLRIVTGSVKASDGDGGTFEISIHYETAGVANIEFQTSIGHGAAACHSGRCLPTARNLFSRQKPEFRNGKQFKPEEIEHYLPALEAVLTYEYEEMLSRVADARTTPGSTTNPSAASESKTLNLAGPAGTYALTLGGDLKPTALLYELNGGPVTGARVEYSDYKKLGDTEYPAKTEIKFREDGHPIAFSIRTVTHSGSAAAQ